MDVDEIARMVEDCFRQRMGLQVTGVIIKESEGTDHPSGRRRVVVQFEGATPLVIYIEIANGLPCMMMGDEPKWETDFNK
jgi:F420-0:gamma-glutamyl ligase